MTASRDDGLFGPDSATWRVHLEPVLFVGGFRALLLQSLHPRVMRGTYQNSALFDPSKAWPRFQRTVEFIGVRTFGSTDEVEKIASRVRRLHGSLRGHDPDTGYDFRLDEPSHLRWVHSTEIESYVVIAQRAGVLDDAGVERYVAESVRSARVIGLDDAPSTSAELRAYIDGVRPELRMTDEARAAVGGLFRARSEAPAVVKAAVPVAVTLALATLPRWARRMYGLPGLPTTDLGVTAGLRALRGISGLLPDVPAPPYIERARQLVRDGRHVSAARPRPRVVGG